MKTTRQVRFAGQSVEASVDPKRKYIHVDMGISRVALVGKDVQRDGVRARHDMTMAARLGAEHLESLPIDDLREDLVSLKKQGEWSTERARWLLEKLGIDTKGLTPAQVSIRAEKALHLPN